MNRRCFLAVLALAASVATVRADENLLIKPVLIRDNKVVVSYELEEAYNAAVKDAIASGLRTSFSYDLELRTKVPAWIDRVIATVNVTVSDEFDNLTRRHHLTRAVDGRIDDDIFTEDDAVVKTWLTTGAKVPLCGTSQIDSTRDYYVRITARTRPATGSFLGLPRTVTGQLKFTFIP
ncbi:MAG TPA: DUF4390 domain-containing protein [Vicinamibacterales bacterium]|jgi:hypothetical protein